MQRALAEYQIGGVRTTLPFARWLMEQPDFIAANLSTDFIAEEWDTREKPSLTVPAENRSDIQDEQPAELATVQVAAIIGGLLMHEQLAREKQRRQLSSSNTDGERSRWRDVARKEMLRRM